MAEEKLAAVAHDAEKMLIKHFGLHWQNTLAQDDMLLLLVVNFASMLVTNPNGEVTADNVRTLAENIEQSLRPLIKRV